MPRRKGIQMMDFGENPRNPAVLCFLSHNETDEHHALAAIIADRFQAAGVELIVDPFPKGVGIRAKIQTVEFHAFLTLSCKGTRESRWCAEELDTAHARDVPVFVVRCDDSPPVSTERIYLDLRRLGDKGLQEELTVLAKQVRTRGLLYRLIRLLGPEHAVEDSRRAAQTLAEEQDTTALAEMLPLLCKKYTPETDPVVRYWIALAVGKTRAPPARSHLAGWAQWEREPLPCDGLRDAARMLCIDRLGSQWPSA